MHTRINNGVIQLRVHKHEQIFHDKSTCVSVFYSETTSTGATQRFSANHKASLEQKNRARGYFRTNHNRSKILFLVWAGIDAKGYAKVHFNAYFYGEMTFILAHGETSERQDKQLFADWRPLILKTKRCQCKICFTAWRPRSLNTKQTRDKRVLLNESRECLGRKRLNTKILENKWWRQKRDKIK